MVKEERGDMAAGCGVSFPSQFKQQVLHSPRTEWPTVHFYLTKGLCC